MDVITMLLLASVVWVGFTYNMAWLSLISIVLLLVYVFGTRTRPSAPVASGKPKVRPIIVKRRYTGPASIYPSTMKIRVNPKWNTNDWWENAFQAGGMVAGIAAQGFRPRGGRKL